MKKLSRILKKIIYFFIPQNRCGDKIAAYLTFFQAHHRMPSKRKTLNDELFRIKTTDEIMRPERTFTSDKELVKLFTKAIVGDCYNVPTIAVLRNGTDIDNHIFLENTVIKPTHASGLIRFIDDVNQINRNELKKWLDSNYYIKSREANYRYLKPKLIVEPLIFGEREINDVKFFCVNGSVRLIQYDFDRHVSHTRRLYDKDWQDLEASLGYPLSNKLAAPPKCLAEMIQIAQALAVYFSFVRIDMFVNKNCDQFLVGEITHCHGNANETFFSRESEKKIATVLFEG